jgi:hypothetical protein
MAFYFAAAVQGTGRAVLQWLPPPDPRKLVRLPRPPGLARLPCLSRGIRSGRASRRDRTVEQALADPAPHPLSEVEAADVERLMTAGVAWANGPQSACRNS